MRTGQNRTMADTNGALNSAARSGWCTAQFFGTASPSTKMTTISNTVAATTPQAPNQWAARMPTRVATTSWQISTIKQDRVEEALGVLGEADQHLRPASAVLDQRQRLGPAHADQAGLGQRQQGRGGQQDRHHHQQRRVADAERPGGRHHAGGAGS